MRMATLPQPVSEAWQRRDGPAVFVTVDPQGTPNAIYVGSVRLYDAGRFVIADNYFDKTRANILAGSAGALLFITTDRLAYQIKGRLEYLTSGPLYEHMRTWVDPTRPRRAATVLHVEQVFQGATQLV